jgi:hypothetical protein
MGFLKSMAKIVFFPVYLPYKAGKKILKKEENPVLAVMTVKTPEVYQYYFEGMGISTDAIGDNIILWRKGVGEKERKEIMEKISSKLQGVV